MTAQVSESLFDRDEGKGYQTWEGPLWACYPAPKPVASSGGRALPPPSLALPWDEMDSSNSSGRQADWEIHGGELLLTRLVGWRNGVERKLADEFPGSVEFVRAARFTGTLWAAEGHVNNEAYYSGHAGPVIVFRFVAGMLVDKRVLPFDVAFEERRSEDAKRQMEGYALAAQERQKPQAADEALAEPNPETFYSKTGKGVQEANGKTSLLSREERAILSAIDGRTTSRDLVAKFESVDMVELFALVDRMEEEGFIRSEVRRAPAPKP